MADKLPVVWPAEPHTLAKHAILKGYLDAWFPILSRQSRRVQGGAGRILFVDGFSGPGEYAGGEPGSPVIALVAALDHAADFRVPIEFLFVEKDPERFAHLREVLGRYEARIAQSKNVVLAPPECSECEIVLKHRLDACTRNGLRFGPALAFLDQFGYSDVPMDLIREILSQQQCEVFSYLDYKNMNRWISDPSKVASFDRAFGGDEWRKATDLREAERRAFLWDAYKAALHERAGAKYVCSFVMFDRNDAPLYWLVFCTNNLRGLEVMKTAMWRVDKSGGFKFSDKDNPDQLMLLEDQFDKDWLAHNLRTALAGKTLTSAEVKEYVLTQTPCYLFKKALAILETDRDSAVQILKSPPKRRRGKFPDEQLDEILVRFREPSLF